MQDKVETTGSDAGLPNNVQTVEDLQDVPDRYLSGNPKRPLLSWDEFNLSYAHALRPMTYSVVFILLVEMLERFSYYGVSFTQNQYLVNDYNPDWGANMTSVDATSYVSTSTAIAYTIPFVGAIVADGFLGDHLTITLFTVLFYIPGLLLIALSAKPDLLGSEFNMTALTVGLLGLYPVGAGGIKSLVNIFGAKQFHPILQSAQIETYYVRFYTAINIGALVGGLTIPPLCTTVGPFVAYMLPVAALTFGIMLFLLATPRYVRMKPSGRAIVGSVKALCAASACWARDSNESSLHLAKPSLDRVKESRGGKYPDLFVDGLRQLAAVVVVTALVVPFNIVYAQMGTTYTTQGMAMQPIGIIDASWMQNADAISVLFFGFIVSTFFYPFLARKGIRIPTSYKFAFGTFSAFLSAGCALIVNSQMKSNWEASQSQVSILWQIPQFLLIGLGEIFAVSASYEAAFIIAPKEQKAFASAINLFLIGGVPQFISTALYHACAEWFQTSDGSERLDGTGDYVETQMDKFFVVLMGIALFGVIFNMLPFVRRWVQKIEDKSRKMEGCAGADPQVNPADDTQVNV